MIRAGTPVSSGGNSRELTRPNRPPYAVGSHRSELVSLLDAGHYGVEIDAAERRALVAWIDCNAVFYGGYSPEEQAMQLAGKELPMPEVQ